MCEWLAHLLLQEKVVLLVVLLVETAVVVVAVVVVLSYIIYQFLLGRTHYGTAFAEINSKIRIVVLFLTDYN